MTGRLDEGLDALERSRDHPSTYSEPFVEMFPVSGAAVSTVGSLLGSETLSASDRLAAKVDELQFDLGEGPCWDAMTLAAPILEPDLRNHPRRVWSAFSPAIEREDVASLFAFPLVLGSLRIGAIDLYSSDRVELDPTQSKHAEAMAAVVSRHVLRRAIDESGEDYADTGNAHSRRVIHQATGMVLAQLRLHSDDALLVIQGHAFATNRTMMDVAHDIVSRTLVFSQSATGIESSS